MRNVIDELRESYIVHTSEPGAVDDTDALILGATAKGDALRRGRRRRRSGAVALVVVVVVAAASVAIARRPDRRLRVQTTAPSPGVPVASDREFPDLARLVTFLEGTVAHDAQSFDDVHAEVVLTTKRAFLITDPSDKAAARTTLYGVQLTGTTFTCDGCSSTRTQPQGPALLVAWDPLAHRPTSVSVGGQPIDLAALGHVYQIVLRDQRRAVVLEACTQADLDRPALAMPAPKRATTSFPVVPGGLARLDPAPNAVPKVSATTAWNVLTRGQPVEARTAELVLGYYRAVPGTAGPRGPVLAWNLRIAHLAYTGFHGGGVPLAGTPTTQRPVCEFTNANLLLDATTGAGIVDAYGG